MSVMISTKEIAYEMNIKPEFRKKQFDKDIDSETTKSLETRVDYFIYIGDQAIFSLQNRFELIEAYENIYDFLFSGKLRTLDNENSFKNIDKDTMLTIHVVIASTETSFSKLKLIKLILDQQCLKRYRMD
ncbi:hypothetical protein H5410_057553 [Solanum commersonii]|uniref:Uncharacterized protein n=1 Tax=Solanum commersonii TaxID=4109 RepID=A0A9J5WN80_SOLCO|nr:hypothetical protein H5410_057553 [Solanum commersonii]